MSLDNTKNHLRSLLRDTDNKVIALTGKWGTGKSHLWREVSKESEIESIKNALYVSLFGLSDLSQVKIKIMQSAIPDDGKSAQYLKALKSITAPFKTILKGLHRSLDVLDELALMATPAILKGKFIVIDDVERKHEKLSIDEILGFIDEFTQKYNSRFLIILNSDKLEKRITWDTLREKVIDHELRLSTLPEQAFDVAATLTPSSHKFHIKKAIISCKINNIRIIRKIIKITNLILEQHKLIPESVLARVIPPTVLLAAISYNGIENGPDFRYVLSANDLTGWENYLKDENKPVDNDSKLKAEWSNLLGNLGIVSCDNYELLVVDFLESGHLDTQGISTIINRYIDEQESFKANTDIANFKSQFLWDHKINESELLVKARGLVPIIKFTNAVTVTELHGMISEISFGSKVAEELIQHWISNFYSNNPETYENDHTVHTQIHKDIRNAIKNSKPKTKMKLDLSSTCIHILETNSWDTIHETTMRRAGPMDFEAAMYTMNATNLKNFTSLMTKIYNNKETYEKHFGNAGNNFYEACQTIINDPTFGRLSLIISRAINVKTPSSNT